ncbi:MAG: hypothetical protein LC122_11855 [Chitinophagales bacterium]|nr:hypothetical protein [Chitinophagales bacterium]
MKNILHFYFKENKCLFCGNGLDDSDDFKLIEAKKCSNEKCSFKIFDGGSFCEYLKYKVLYIPSATNRYASYTICSNDKDKNNVLYWFFCQSFEEDVLELKYIMRVLYWKEID